MAINVKTFGARGDGTGDDSGAIQKALDAGKGLVEIPAGKYAIGKTLKVGSGTAIKANPDAHIFYSDGAGVDSRSFLLANSDPEKGNAEITVEGGIWDGNNPGNPRGADNSSEYTGTLLDFCNVRGLVLRNMVLQDGEAYFIRLGEVQGFTVEGISFRTKHIRPNQDGIHLGGFCEDGVISNISGVGKAVPNDDVVALNADDALGRVQNIGLKCGPIRRIRISDIRAEDAHTFVRILSVNSPIEDVEITGIRGGCAACAINMDAARKCKVPIFDENDPKFAGGVGEVNRVSIKDLEVYKTTRGMDNTLVDVMTRTNGFSVEDFRRDYSRDKNPGVPTLNVERVGSASIHLAGLDGEQVEGIRGASRDLRGGAGSPYELGKDSALILPRGGFTKMSIGRV